MNNYELHVQDSDELGPGSDLVISMFAMAMLVVAFVGSGFGSEGTSPSRPQNAETNELKQLRDRALELETVQESSKRRIQQLQAQVLELEAKLEVPKPKEIRGDVLITLRYSAGTNRFSRGSAQISNDEQQHLIDTLRQKASSIRDNQFNTIVVEGYASSEPRWRAYTDTDGQQNYMDTNEQLAFERADAVAKVLVLAGIPRRCLGLMSYGRNRSEILYGPFGFKPGGSEKDTNEFDKAYFDKKLVPPEDKLAAERRIEIRAVSDPKYTLCTPSELAQQLSAARLP